MHYWFKPARFWKWFAAYYPISWQGWVVSLLLASVAGMFFYRATSMSHSVSETLLNFSPWAIILLLIFDVFCFRTGEFPSWWRRRTHKQNLV